MKDSATENKTLREQLRKLTQNAAKNEAILAHLQGHELALLRAESLPRLLECLLIDTKDAFGLDAVSLILQDPYHEIRNLLTENSVQANTTCLDVLFVDRVEIQVPAYAHLQEPCLGAYQASQHQILFPQREAFGSVALLPLTAHHYLFGGLNLASSDANRYTPNHASDLLNHLGVIAAVSLENMLNRERLLHNTFTDMLTGCYNRRYLDRRLLQEIARAQRNQHSLCCLFFDLDHFKQVNDDYGHLCGDKVLREVAQRLQQQLRLNDVAVRYGGEEFAILLPDITSQDAIPIAERIRQAVAAPIVWTEHTLNITASIGMAEALPSARTIDFSALGERLLATADEALYAAKDAGRDRVICASERLT